MDGGFSEYDQNISDHRPVALKLTSNMIILGDINNDGISNILDIISIIIMILENEYSLIADLNLDETVDILDVIQLINIILS